MRAVTELLTVSGIKLEIVFSLRILAQRQQSIFSVSNG